MARDDLGIPSFLLVANHDKPLPATIARKMKVRLKQQQTNTESAPPPLFDTLPRNIQAVVPRSIDEIGLAMFAELTKSRQEKTAERIAKLKATHPDSPGKPKRPKTNIIRDVIAAMREPGGVSVDEIGQQLAAKYPGRTVKAWCLPQRGSSNGMPPGSSKTKNAA